MAAEVVELPDPVSRVKNASMFKAARAVADNCRDPVRRNILRDRIDACREAFDVFCVTASQTHMETLVARWTRMLLAIAAIDPLGGEPTGAGRMPVPRDAEPAAIAPALDLSRFTA